MPTPNTPASRIAAAIANAPPQGLREVTAADVQAVTATVAADKATDTTRALAQGAAGAMSGYSGEAAARITLYVAAADLGQLLEAAGVHAQ